MDIMYLFSKKWFGFFGLVGIGLMLAVAAQAVVYPEYPVIDYAHVAQPDLVKKGEYLTKTGDCIACHTDSAHGGKVFAGGLGIETPFGAFYSPNITADKTSGIGSWSDTQFIAAVREGNGPHGNYFPVFPFLYFNKMSDEDVLAIKAYLFAVPKVHNEAPEDQVPWPFDVRLAQYGWKALFFYPYRGVYKPDPARSAVWNRGAYLVEGPTHCGMCHSPLNLLGAEKRKYRYTGGFVQGFYAPDITSVGLRKYSIQQIVRVLKSGKTLSGSGRLAGPMLEAYEDSFKYLTYADAEAIATYLKTVVSEEPAKSDGAVTTSTGPALYGKYCSACHANGANDAPVFGDKAAWQKALKGGIDMVMQHAINGFNAMPPMGNCATCSQAQIRAAVQYMIDESMHADADAKPKAQDYFYDLPRLPESAGQALYQQHCAVCHDASVRNAPNAPKMGDTTLWAKIFAEKNFDDILDTVLTGQNGKSQAVHPLHGGCAKCSTPEIIAASKYLAQKNAQGTYDFSLW
jgi:cytochrome c5